MEIRSVRDAEIKGKRVLVRCDLDVLEGSHVIDDRLRAAVPTLQLLHDQGAAQVIVIGHAGRPGGKAVEELRVAPAAARLRELAPGIDFEVKENLRFDPREEANDPAFAQELASLGDLFVNEAFADSHRNHASIVGIPKFLPSYAGLQFEKEIAHLARALVPAHPALAIVGGAKGDKEPLIEKLSALYDKVLVGGALANDCRQKKENIFLPVDGIPQKEGMCDIGPITQERWAQEITRAQFVLWNGPVGMYEKKEYAGGTDALAKAIAESGVAAVIGGGDTIAALAKFTFDPEKVFLSTGGGAMLEFLANGTLPGIEALKNSSNN